MKKILLSAFALFLFSNVQAAEYESVFLSNDMNQCVDQLQLDFSIHTERIRQDEGLLSGNYFVNPFRNIQRAIRQEPEVMSLPCYQKLDRFIQNALFDLNTSGDLAVYGDPVKMGYFVRQGWRLVVE